MDAPGEKYVSIAFNSKYKKQLILLSRISVLSTFLLRFLFPVGPYIKWLILF